MKERAFEIIAFCRRQGADPRFFFYAAAIVFVLFALVSGGFGNTRQSLFPQDYAQAGDLIVVSQQFPFMGMRSGVRDRDLATWKAQSKTLADTASYDWVTVSKVANRRAVRAALVSPNFFAILRVRTAPFAPGTFLASEAFFKDVWRGDRRAIGQSYEVDGVPMRLGGVLPAGFHFLSQSPDIWIPNPPPGPPHVLARLTPGATAQQAEDELYQLRFFAIPATKFEPEVSPLRFLANRVRWMYGSFFAAALLLAGVWAAVLYLRDPRRVFYRGQTRRFWGVFGLRLSTLLILIALAVFEFTGVHRMGAGGERPFLAEFLAVWVSLFGTGFAAYWTYSGSRLRCRVCLTRMSLPVRIGEPGRLIFDFDGSELLCPKGHGTLYTPESALETHEPEHWNSFEETTR